MKLRPFSTFLALGVTLAPLVAHAQTPRTIYLYNSALGTPAPGSTAAKTGPWGNGEAKTARTIDYEGAPVLQITTRNFSEGARFDLQTPVEVAPYRDNGFLRLRLQFGSTTAPAAGEMGAPTPGMAPPGMAPGAPPRRGGFGGIGAFQMRPVRENAVGWQGAAQFGGALPPLGAGGEFPMPDGTAPIAAAPTQITPIKLLQLTVVLDSGVLSGRIPINLDTAPADENGWRLFVLPVKDLHSTPGAAGAARRLVLTADAQDTFFMAQAALVIETGAMTVSIRTPDLTPGAQIAEITVKPGPLSLIADVEAGAADPAIEWNFDADAVGNLPPAALNGPAAMGQGPLAGGAPPVAPEDARPLPGGRRVPATPNPEAAPAVAEQVGPRLDARGLTATFNYPDEEQNYRVEVTVRDRSGQKQPVRTSLLVKVRG